MTENPILWRPSPDRAAQTQMAEFMTWLPKNGYPKFSNYLDLHRWSVDLLEDFWMAVWEWSGVVHQAPPKQVLAAREMPGADWFPGARLNFAENLLRSCKEGRGGKPAITSVSETGARRTLRYRELWDQVAAMAAFLRSRGVVAGDRVAGVVSHTPEPIIAMLAATSIGAIWSSCSPDFGVQGIYDRFGQIEPKILFSVDGYSYGGKVFSIRDRVDEIRKKVSSIEGVVWIPQISEAAGSQGPTDALWDTVISQNRTSDLVFESLPFSHPVYILYSSGTTGVPKCIVHGAGGTLLQHTKELRLHTDVRDTDRFFYFTTCGWMMWNWQVSGLMTGAELILYDGSPAHPSLRRLWQLAEDLKISIFGTSAKFLGSSRGGGLSPGREFDLTSLRTITSTGSPLLPEDFDWVYGNVKADLQLASISGGTDIVSCFVLGNPTLPVYRGEIQCKGLGMNVKAYGDGGREVVGEKGELVCASPAPSMPVKFWNDPKGEKYRKAYFGENPSVWRHGDWILFNDHGGAVIYGRSDSTLNPGGVRIGTAEIYRQVETLDEIQDSLAVGQPWQGDERVVLFVVLKQGNEWSADLDRKIRERIRTNTTPRHVPSKIVPIQEIPYTISGKKVEVAVAKILRGESVDNRDALANPHALDQFFSIPDLQS